MHNLHLYFPPDNECLKYTFFLFEWIDSICLLRLNFEGKNFKQWMHLILLVIFSDIILTLIDLSVSLIILLVIDSYFTSFSI